MKKTKTPLAILLAITIFALAGCVKNPSPSPLTTVPAVSQSTTETECESETETEIETEEVTQTTTEKAEESKTESSTSKPTAATAVPETEIKSETTEKKTIIRRPDASASFFDDAVFVGDSVSLGLRSYVSSRRNSGEECLGSAQFLVAGSMGYANSRGKIGSANSVHPKYKGKEVTIEDGVALTGAKKVFIMLGLNDFCIYSIDESMKNFGKTVDLIREKNPDVKIYVQSVTPVVSARERGKFNNDNIDAFNNALRKAAKQHGCEFVDIAPIMKNADGCFKDEYCSDPEDKGVHMNKAGSKAWVDYLTQKYDGRR